jgi:hypothetical protein
MYTATTTTLKVVGIENTVRTRNHSEYCEPGAMGAIISFLRIFFRQSD